MLLAGHSWNPGQRRLQATCLPPVRPSGRRQDAQNAGCPVLIEVVHPGFSVGEQLLQIQQPQIKEGIYSGDEV